MNKILVNNGIRRIVWRGGDSVVPPKLYWCFVDRNPLRLLRHLRLQLIVDVNSLNRSLLIYVSDVKL